MNRPEKNFSTRADSATDRAEAAATRRMYSQLLALGLVVAVTVMLAVVVPGENFGLLIAAAVLSYVVIAALFEGEVSGGRFLPRVFHRDREPVRYWSVVLLCAAMALAFLLCAFTADARPRRSRGAAQVSATSVACAAAHPASHPVVSGPLRT